MSLVMIERIASKEQSVELFLKGYFGNRVRQWNTLKELMMDDFSKNIVIRQRSRKSGGRGITIYDIQKSALQRVTRVLLRSGVPESSLYFNEAIVPRNVVFQGEITRSYKGLYLLFSTYPHHMHVALAKQPEHAFGLRAKLLMEHYVCEQGLECIWDLLNRFENHVVEFTVCSEVFGTLSWRTIVWECRIF